MRSSMVNASRPANSLINQACNVAAATRGTTLNARTCVIAAFKTTITIATEWFSTKPWGAVVTAPNTVIGRPMDMRMQRISRIGCAVRTSASLRNYCSLAYSA